MDELKVKQGDKLLYRYRNIERIVTVTRVTPTGRIRIDRNDCQYNKYGSEIGTSHAWYHSHLYMPKDEDFERIKIAETIKQASEILSKLADDVDYETALKVIEIFGKEQSEIGKEEE